MFNTSLKNENFIEYRIHETSEKMSHVSDRSNINTNERRFNISTAAGITHNVCNKVNKNKNSLPYERHTNKLKTFLHFFL